MVEREYINDEEIKVIDNDEEFLRLKAVPVIQEMTRRKIVGFSDGDYWYEIVRKKEKE